MIFLRAALFAALMIVPFQAIAASKVESAYAFATAPVQKNGAAFVTVVNDGDADRLVEATTPVAEIAELHTMSMDDGIMQMRKVEGYDVPAQGTLKLAPMGNHIMLMGIKNPLKPGETFPLTLRFEKQGLVEVNVEIKNPGETPD